ncbi:hypothetical protein HanXRQr2_Chr11g0505011 [Helianthus annuus]|uniref:ARGOS-like protein n=1 Tax=Helianthus annuus TaxID=4232 RepID=A0A9K3N180_HELAN|nr:hypothetical protein HanXRQr2_Chr11g0505011 [Helianthus annuus]
MDTRRMNMNMSSSYGSATTVEQRWSVYRKTETMVSKTKSDFSVETVLVLVGLAASLLILPLILPPLPPPPLMLLLLPIVILGGLMVFAFLPNSWSASGRHKRMV